MKTIIIGTAADCDLRVEDEYASGHHASLTQDAAGNYVVQDLGSTNGTRIVRGGQMVKVLGGSPLLPGDRIMVGRTTLPWEAE